MRERGIRARTADQPPKRLIERLSLLDPSHELELELTAAYMSLPVHSVEMVLGVRAGFELQLGGASQSRRSVQVTLPTHTAFAVAAQVVPLEHAAAVEECDAVLRVSRKTVAP